MRRGAAVIVEALSSAEKAYPRLIARLARSSARIRGVVEKGSSLLTVTEIMALFIIDGLRRWHRREGAALFGRNGVRARSRLADRWAMPCRSKQAAAGARALIES